jgi:hypothetical protein
MDRLTIALRQAAPDAVRFANGQSVCAAGRYHGAGCAHGEGSCIPLTPRRPPLTLGMEEDRRVGVGAGTVELPFVAAEHGVREPRELTGGHGVGRGSRCGRPGTAERPGTGGSPTETEDITGTGIGIAAFALNVTRGEETQGPDSSRHAGITSLTLIESESQGRETGGGAYRTSCCPDGRGVRSRPRGPWCIGAPRDRDFSCSGPRRRAQRFPKPR